MASISAAVAFELNLRRGGSTEVAELKIGARWRETQTPEPETPKSLH